MVDWFYCVAMDCPSQGNQPSRHWPALA